VVATARSFAGLPYLWAGTSGFGLDCSGFTWLVYRAHGIVIPRDAAPQSHSGRAVARLRRGDLTFYAANGLVHHVAMYVGRGLMVHSPRTGVPVQVIPLWTDYVSARTELP
jgi:cell wall-associated NlpC family hydrolase